MVILSLRFINLSNNMSISFLITNSYVKFVSQKITRYGYAGNYRYFERTT